MSLDRSQEKTSSPRTSVVNAERDGLQDVSLQEPDFAAEIESNQASTGLERVTFIEIVTSPIRTEYSDQVLSAQDLKTEILSENTYARQLGIFYLAKESLALDEFQEFIKELAYACLSPHKLETVILTSIFKEFVSEEDFTEWSDQARELLSSTESDYLGPRVYIPGYRKLQDRFEWFGECGPRYHAIKAVSCLPKQYAAAFLDDVRAVAGKVLNSDNLRHKAYAVLMRFPTPENLSIIRTVAKDASPYLQRQVLNEADEVLHERIFDGLTDLQVFSVYKDRKNNCFLRASALRTLHCRDYKPAATIVEKVKNQNSSMGMYLRRQLQAL